MKAPPELLNGYILFLSDDLEGAEAAFREALKRQPGNLIALQNLIITLVRENKLDEAERFLEEFESKLTRRGKRVTRLLDALRFLIKAKRGDVDSALESFERAFFDEIYIFPPDWEEVPSVVFDLKMYFNVDDETLSKLKRWLSHPKRGEAVLNLPVGIREAFYELLKRKKESLNDHQKLIYAILAISVNSTTEAHQIVTELSGKELEARDYVFIAKIYYIFGKLNKAFELLKKAQELGDSSLEYVILTNMAALLYRIGDYKPALEYVTKALKKKVDCYICWYLRGKILIMLEKWGDAERSLKLSLSYYKDYPNAWIALANVYLNKGRIPEAIEALLNALRVGGDPEAVSFSLELLRYMLGGEQK